MPAARAPRANVSVELLDWRLRGALVRTRLPFRFGIVEMTELVHVLLFATVEVDGVRQLGIAADNLAPKWFTKRPETSYREDAAEMVGVIERACAAAARCGSRESAFDLWLEVYRGQVVAEEAAVPPLLSSFGVSLVERAVIDACCRARQVPFAEAVRGNLLGVRLGELHPGLAGRWPREFLPSRPLPHVRIRHTVGLGDALVEGENPGPAPGDGLPATLEAAIPRYGLRRFKVKVSGNADEDLDRLERVGDVLERETRGDYRLTLDGNEQFATVSVLRAFWEALCSSPRTAELARRVDYVEQPLPRALALGPGVRAELAAWPGRPRLIVDESDDSLDAVERALDAGYDGGSFKSCKGVFKGIGNACRIAQLRREGRDGLIYSAEDLSTIGPVGLLADLAAIATLGIDEPERNGYHYLRDLAGLSPRTRRETLRHHGDLYAPQADGSPVLRIEDGAIAVGSVVAAPFGVGWCCDIEEELESAGSVVDALA